MIVFLVSMAVGFLTFAAGFVFGIRYGVQQEEDAHRLSKTVTYNDPGIDVPLMTWLATEGTRITERAEDEEYKTDINALWREFNA